MSTVLIAVLALTLRTAFGYDEDFDKTDINKILGDEDLYHKYVDCLLDKGPCEVENSQEVRKIIQEVVAEACAKCNPIQKSHVRKVVKELEKKPELLEEFKTKYDPNGDYEKDFITFLEALD